MCIPSWWFARRALHGATYWIYSRLFTCVQAQKIIVLFETSPRAWYEKMDSFLLSLGFSHCLSDSNVYILRKDNELLILVLYVDDLILTGSSTILIDKVKFDLQQQFDMADLGLLHYFLGLHVTQYRSLTTQICIRSLVQIPHDGLQICTHTIFFWSKVVSKVLYSFGWCYFVSTTCWQLTVLDSYIRISHM